MPASSAPSTAALRRFCCLAGFLVYREGLSTAASLAMTVICLSFRAYAFAGEPRGTASSPEPTALGQGTSNQTGGQQSSGAATNTILSFVGHGVITEVPTNGNSIVIRHEDIPGFMPKMTMEFAVRDTNELHGLRAGDVITFHVRATEEESWIEQIKRNGNSEPVQPLVQPLRVLTQSGELRPGAFLPDQELTGEDGKTVKFSAFQGRALAFTFLFTRCPIPEFCPRMSQHFSRARELLLHMPGGPTNWQFLSISFDGEFDTPEVLSRYAQNYRGQNLDRWLFAAAPAKALETLTSELDFRYRDNQGNLVHNLRTIVLDPQGRIYKRFDGNQWSAGELAQALAEAARLPAPRQSARSSDLRNALIVFRE